MARPKLGMQGPVIAWQDSWAGAASDEIMRTGTGSVYPSQEALPAPDLFLQVLKELGCDFYVHHMFPNGAGQSAMVRDMAKHGMDLCLGNEYGNINGPYAEGTNRYDVPDEALLEAAGSGKLIGLLYDEPEHLQINASQYRKDAFLPHWGTTEENTLRQSQDSVVRAVAERTAHVRGILANAGVDPEGVPLVGEFVFPTLFHTKARGGMIVCPKIMKESFQSLQLSTALGAAKQYGRGLWICADLWGPDVGPWFIRTPGFPGHSPEEYASALKMGYFMGPTHLFTENIDALLQHGNGSFRRTEFGEVWEEFVRDFIPAHPLTWSHAEADPDIAFIHSDDSNYGQNARLFGNRGLAVPDAAQSVFRAWHLLSHGTIPAHGSCMHIPGFAFPRHRLKAEVPRDEFPLLRGRPHAIEERVHPLYYPTNNVLVFDETVREEQLGNPKLILVAGTRLSAETLKAVRRRAEAGATVMIADWLVPEPWKASGRTGEGKWLVTGDFLSDDRVKEEAGPHLGGSDCWMQRFADAEVRMYKADERGFMLDFEIRKR
ncbi:hypothetical protein [Paenibacillus sp. Y412MC10]|uniref:hypothetical protein n=1 Tax=Geobacillus sp. (strain Y412MC10) TaxID=481743 RepID=UPI0001789C34|nr:hypothetical protein [Paenibacillus sp. Y412MC10]ACX65268.1 hypothetical protein GYMC10_3002 [Paenibacillus sp. Y412MC10]